MTREHFIAQQMQFCPTTSAEAAACADRVNPADWWGILERLEGLSFIYEEDDGPIHGYGY